MRQNTASNDLKKTATILLRQKEKTHAQTQIVEDKRTRQIICTQAGKGRRQDSHLYKSSQVYVHPQTETVVDSDYPDYRKYTLKPKSHKKEPRRSP